MASMHQTQCVPQLEKTWILSVLLLMCEIENSISQSQHARIYLKSQLNSEWTYEVIVSPQMPTKKFLVFYPPSNKLPGQKSLQFFVGIFGETMTS